MAQKVWFSGKSKQLTRKQLQNDLDAARMHLARAEEAEEKARQNFHVMAAAARVDEQKIARLTEERDDWRFAFRTICKLVEK